VHRLAHHRIRSRCHWKLEDGYLVEGNNVGIHGGAGGDKGADSLWIPGLTAVEVDRSVKVRRDSRKRSQLILANIGHLLRCKLVGSDMVGLICMRICTW
jgi:hypothetical protein